MIVMQDLFEQGKYEEAQKYFEGLPKTRHRKTMRLLTGNETVDTILAAKGDVLKQYKIEVKLSGSLERLKQMDAVDICILFANLLDNAIDALAQYEGKRNLSIKVTESAGAMMFIMENPMNGDIKRVGDRLMTTKQDDTQHGVGLRNVQEVVAKYKGECRIETEDNMFIVKIILPISE